MNNNKQQKRQRKWAKYLFATFIIILCWASGTSDNLLCPLKAREVKQNVNEKVRKSKVEILIDSGKDVCKNGGEGDYEFGGEGDDGGCDGGEGSAVVKWFKALWGVLVSNWWTDRHLWR